MKQNAYLPPVCETVELMTGSIVLNASDPDRPQIAPAWEDDYDEL